MFAPVPLRDRSEEPPRASDPNGGAVRLKLPRPRTWQLAPGSWQLAVGRWQVAENGSPSRS
jgi:hypothetical protein